MRWCRERGRLMAVLEGVPFLQPYSSASNFILCKVTVLWRLQLYALPDASHCSSG